MFESVLEIAEVQADHSLGAWLHGNKRGEFPAFCLDGHGAPGEYDGFPIRLFPEVLEILNLAQKIRNTAHTGFLHLGRDSLVYVKIIAFQQPGQDPAFSRVKAGIPPAYGQGTIPLLERGDEAHCYIRHHKSILHTEGIIAVIGKTVAIQRDHPPVPELNALVDRLFGAVADRILDPLIPAADTLDLGMVDLLRLPFGGCGEIFCIHAQLLASPFTAAEMQDPVRGPF